MSEVERFDMPNGTSVFYKDASHSYWGGYDEKKGTCSKRIPGISTVSKHDGDGNSDPLLDWAARLTVDGVCQAAGSQLNEEWLASSESITRVLRASKATWRDVRNQAGTRGSLSHDVLQQLAEGVTPIQRSGFDAAVLDWWKKRRPEALNVEQVVYSAEKEVAGRFDLRCSLGGETVLLDLKTSKFVSNAFHIQLAGYELCAREAGIGESDKQVILQVRADGSWDEWEGCASELDFLTALSAYRMGKRIGGIQRAMRKEREDARAVRQAA